MDAERIERYRSEMEREAERGGPPDGFPRLSPIPAGRYRDPHFFELEREHLWPQLWLLAAHVDELREPGHFVVWDRVGPRIIIVRGRDDVIRAFYDVCQHRGGSVVRERSGKAKRFVCGFHAWVYDLDGTLVGVPDEADFPGLERSCNGLRPVRCETWGGWIYLNQDEAAAPLLDFLGAIPGDMEQFGPDRLRLLDRHSVPVQCNWKVAADAFVEVYHLRHLHSGTIDRLLDYRKTTIGLLPGGHSRMVTAKRPESLDAGFGMGAPLIETLSELPRFANLSFFTFPNVLTTTDTTGFPCLQFWPVDVGNTLLEVSWFVGDWGGGDAPEHWQNAVKIFDMVLGEDLPNLVELQRGVESPGCSEMQIGYQERRIHHYHEEIDRVMGESVVPPGLRVPAELESVIEGGS